MKRTDIRIQFTRKVLRESLLALMKEKSILNITIKEICEHAGLSRSTFYTYYDDQYDLLKQIENETFVESDRILQPHLNVLKKSNSLKPTVILEDMLQFIANNSNSIQVLLSKNGDSAFQRKFFRRSIEQALQFTKATGVKQSDEKMAGYSSVFWAGGMIALVQEWLQNDMDTPAPELAKMLTRIMRDTLK